MIASIYHTNQPATIGILGGGQLAKMLAQSAYKMGLRVAIIEHGENSPAGVMTKHEFSQGWNNEDDVREFTRISDVITLENEFIDPDIIESMEEQRLVFPSSATLRLIQDKYTQKLTMQEAGIPVPVFAKVDSAQELVDFCTANGFPSVAKTRKFGYDGYGNATVRTEADCHAAFTKFTSGDSPREVMVEQFVEFTKELAVIVVRNRRGEVAVYPCVQTIQQNHICTVVLAPAPIPQEIQERAQAIAVQCVQAINGVGVFGVELFLTESNDIIFNEIAPRPHNSGHYTIEGCRTSQFENGIRAVLNLPLGSTELVAPAAVMINVLGERNGVGTPDSVVEMLKNGNASFHLYGKKDSRIGRKMGHITALGNSVNEAFAFAKNAIETLVW